ncbi:MAG: hypothetical protein ACJAS1_006327 [Oleiphilaceae bacterium]|jgi:hypothetical protein
MGLFSSLFGRKKKQEVAPYPSWAGDSAKMQEFLSTIKELAKHENIPEKFLLGIMTNDYAQDKVLFIAGIMEQQGSSYKEQVKASMDHIERYWSNTDDKKMWLS